jgi:DNA-binding transcriptional regulator YiaG
MPVNQSSSLYWAKLIKSIRDSLQISQNKFSELLGIDQTTVSRWERGLCEPQYEMRKILHEMA